MMKKIIFFLLIFSLFGCGLSDKEKDNIADITCAIMVETRNMDSSIRVKEINRARKELGEEPYLDGDRGIVESFRYDLCSELVKNDKNYYNQINSLKERERVAEAQRLEKERIAAAKKAERERIAAAKKAERERIAAAKKAERERIAAEEKAERERLAAAKKAERERIAAEEKAERERIAAEEKAERERIAAEEIAESMHKYRVAAEKELSKYRFSLDYKNERYPPLRIAPDKKKIALNIYYSPFEGTLASFDGNMNLHLESITVDFIAPELPDLVINSTYMSMYGGKHHTNKNYSKSKRIWATFYFTNLTSEQRTLFVNKFGTNSMGIVELPKNAFNTTIKVIGITTSSREPFKFECENFTDLKNKDMCSSTATSIEPAKFSEPLKIKF